MQKWYKTNIKLSYIYMKVEIYSLYERSIPGGTHMLRYMGMCCPNGLLFHQKSLDMGPILVKKQKSWVEGPISQKLQKSFKISCFWGGKTLRNGSRFANILKKMSNRQFFEWEKSLDMGWGFRPRAAHSVKKSFKYPPQSIIPFHLPVSISHLVNIFQLQHS